MLLKIIYLIKIIFPKKFSCFLFFTFENPPITIELFKVYDLLQGLIVCCQTYSILGVLMSASQKLILFNVTITYM